MNRYMFDCNIFDKILLIHEVDNSEYYVPATVVEELANIPDTRKEKRVALLLKLCELNIKLVPVIAVVGYSRIGYSLIPFCDEERYYNEINAFMNAKDHNKSHVKDAMIAVASQHNKCILVTEDKLLREAIIQNGGKTCSWDDFYKQCFTGKE